MGQLLILKSACSFMSSNSTLHRQKISIVVPEMLPVPPVQGGAVEYWVHEVSKRLDQSKFDITIVSRPAHALGVAGIKYEGIAWTKLSKLFYAVKERLSKTNPLRHLAKIQNVAAYGWQVAKLVGDADLVVIHNEPNLLLFLRRNNQQKVILHIHNEHLNIRLFRLLYRLALKKVDEIVCVSDYIRRSAIKHFPEYADKFSVVFNATDPQIFKPYGQEAITKLQSIVSIQADKTYLLYVGRLNALKGVHVLIEAFNQIHERLPHTRLIIAGSSFFGGAAKTSYEASLVTLAQPIADAIIFTGYIPHDQLKYLYSAVDIVILPSVWQDPCPLVALEAMASGTCLIATEAGGVVEVVQHQLNGWLVPPNDADALTIAIHELVDNPIKRAQLAQQARKLIEQKYDWARLVGQLETSFLNKRVNSKVQAVDQQENNTKVTP